MSEGHGGREKDPVHTEALRFNSSIKVQREASEPGPKRVGSGKRKQGEIS